MPARALAWLLLTLLPVVVPAGTVAAAGDPPPPDTVNEFIPENRDLSECVSALPKPGRVRELLELCSRLHSTRLAWERPLWEAHVIEGLRDGRVAMYIKTHHALVDGVSAMRS